MRLLYQNITGIRENQEGTEDNTNIVEPEELKVPTAKRKQCNRVAESFKRLGHENKAIRVMNCGTQMIYAHITAEDRMELHRANFCRERLCPMCAAQRSRRIFAQASQVMNVIELERSELTPIFLTLTLRNCNAEELNKTLDVVFQGWHRLMNNDRMKRLILGWFRGLEVTYNEGKDTYHPHIHAILMVPPSYFVNPKDYMTTEKWVKTWRKALRLDYDPTCDIRAIAGAADRRAGAVAEVAKYTVKDADYLKEDETLTDKLISVFSAAIKGRRLVAFGGLMKEIAKRLKLDFEKLVPGEVTDKDGAVLRKDIDYVLRLYRWNIGLSRYYYDGMI